MHLLFTLANKCPHRDPLPLFTIMAKQMFSLNSHLINTVAEKQNVRNDLDRELQASHEADRRLTRVHTTRRYM